MKIKEVSIIDRYIIKKIFFTFFISILLILAIGILIDISEKIDSFSRSDLSFGNIFKEYYINFIIYYGNLFIPLFIFISTIWVTSSLSNDTEIVPIVSSGVSFIRLMKPYVIVSLFFFVMSLLLSHFLVPSANKNRIDFENKYVKSNPNNKEYENIYRQVKINEYIYIPRWKPNEYRAEKGFIYTKFNPEGKMVYRFYCEKAVWDKDSLKFSVRNYQEKIINSDYSEKIYQGYVKDTAFGFSVENMVSFYESAAIKKTNELETFIKEEKMRGAENLKSHLVEFHKRTSIPFSVFILVFIAFMLSYKKKRGGTGVNLAFGISLAFIYIFLMRVTDMLAIKGSASPLLAVWSPNIIFGIVYIFIYKINKD